MYSTPRQTHGTDIVYGRQPTAYLLSDSTQDPETVLATSNGSIIFRQSALNLPHYCC